MKICLNIRKNTGYWKIDLKYLSISFGTNGEMNKEKTLTHKD